MHSNIVVVVTVFDMFVVDVVVVVGAVVDVVVRLMCCQWYAVRGPRISMFQRWISLLELHDRSEKRWVEFESGRSFRMGGVWEWVWPAFGLV